MNNSNARHIATNKRCRVERTKDGIHFCCFSDSNNPWTWVSVLAVELDENLPKPTTPTLTTQLYNALKLVWTPHIYRYLDEFDHQALNQAHEAAKLYEDSIKGRADTKMQVLKEPEPAKVAVELPWPFSASKDSTYICVMDERRNAERRGPDQGFPNSWMRRKAERRGAYQPKVEVPRNSTTLTLSQLRVLLCVKVNGFGMNAEIERELVKLGYLYKVGGGLTLFGAERVEAALKGEKA